MNESDINKYIETGSTNSICVDRSLSDVYPGLVREIVIRKNNELIIEYNVHGYDEGGVIFIAKFNSLDELLESVEKLINKKMSEWSNYTATGEYPEIDFDINIKLIREKLSEDLINNNVELPIGEYELSMPSGYWKDLTNKGVGNE